MDTIPEGKDCHCLFGSSKRKRGEHNQAVCRPFGGGRLDRYSLFIQVCEDKLGWKDSILGSAYICGSVFRHQRGQSNDWLVLKPEREKQLFKREKGSGARSSLHVPAKTRSLQNFSGHDPSQGDRFEISTISWWEKRWLARQVSLGVSLRLNPCEDLLLTREGEPRPCSGHRGEDSAV